VKDEKVDVRADRRSRSSRRVGKNGKWMWVEKKKRKVKDDGMS